MAKHPLPLIALPVLLAAPASAQDLPCPDIPVNTYTTGVQALPALAADASGNFVAVWQSYNQDGSHDGVFGQRFSAAGVRRGSEFQVNTFTTDAQRSPRVASEAGGSFVVVWSSRTQDAGGSGIFGRRFDAAGAPQGPEFQINSYTTGDQYGPRVALGGGGQFVVAWTHSDGSVGAGEVRARVFSAAGVPTGPDFQVNTYTTHMQGVALDVASDPGGNFVVVWNSYGQDGSGWGVFGQRFDAAGVAQGPEFQVNTYNTGFQILPSVAAGPDGGFVVVWASETPDEKFLFRDVFGQRFDASGVPQGPEFRVNKYTTSDQVEPTVAFDTNGDFVVVWESYEQDGSLHGIFGRRFSSRGVSLGPEFRVNTYTTGRQLGPAIARGARGGFVVAWFSEPDGPAQGGDIIASLDCARLYTVTPCRVTDTRIPPALPLAANSTRVLPVAGLCNVPLDARAVAFNVTAVNPTDLGNLRLYPAGQPLPDTSTVNFKVGGTRANNAVMPLGANGQIAVRCDMPPDSPGSTHLVLDVFGYFKR